MPVGCLLWVLSPSVFGAPKPWDVEGPVYLLGMVGGGALAGLVGGRFELAIPAYLAAWLGQVVALIVMPTSQLGWLPLGVITTGIGSLLFFLGCVPGGGLRRALQRDRGA